MVFRAIYLLLIPIFLSGSTFLDVDYMSERENDMLSELNKLRTHPTSYLPYIDGYLDYWKSSSGERKKAKELINYLKMVHPVGKLSPSPELCKYAQKHAKWMVRNNLFQHSTFKGLNYGENLVGGSLDIKYALLDLMIDYGHADNGHRKNIMNPAYKTIGIAEANGKVKGMNAVFVQLFQR